MDRCHVSTMCIICTVVSVMSLSIIVGLWTFQFLSFSEQTRSRTARSDGCPTPECPLLPVSYEVKSWPDAEGLHIFTGNSSVVFECVKETDLILIHANKLNLTSEATLSTLHGSPAPSIKSTNKTAGESRCLAFYLSGKLKAGERYRLHAGFRAELTEHLGGFYRKEYQHGVKKSRRHTQPTHTNTHTPGMFLCCDETKTKPESHISLLQERGTVTNAEQIGSADDETPPYNDGAARSPLLVGLLYGLTVSRSQQVLPGRSRDDDSGRGPGTGRR
ncbi:aminopeptidase N-like isoform X2 [Hemibagrus wyckioides]|uniref:aminopeptidase N-like isoform X2 n=1 Tax=Hemibagrus wyckioides TaxID=337641 RepID=UPI00266D2E4A|nr:aminopeptidase N-like isoform X2 [Hemibagrus wyckioides]